MPVSTGMQSGGGYEQWQLASKDAPVWDLPEDPQQLPDGSWPKVRLGCRTK